MNKPQGRVPIRVTAIKQVLPYLKKFYKLNGYMPSVTEIADNFGQRTPEWGRMCLLELVKAKLISRIKGKVRAIKILKK